MKIIDKKFSISLKFIIIFLLAFVLFLYFYIKFDTSKEISRDEILKRIEGMVVLPTDETPTIATVTDLLPLRDSLFFKNAKLGDKVIIYAKLNRAILYRANDNKIVEVSSLNIDNI